MRTHDDQVVLLRHCRVCNGCAALYLSIRLGVFVVVAANKIFI